MTPDEQVTAILLIKDILTKLPDKALDHVEVVLAIRKRAVVEAPP